MLYGRVIPSQRGSVFQPLRKFPRLLAFAEFPLFAIVPPRGIRTAGVLPLISNGPAQQCLFSLCIHSTLLARPANLSGLIGGWSSERQCLTQAPGAWATLSLGMHAKIRAKTQPRNVQPNERFSNMIARACFLLLI